MIKKNKTAILDYGVGNLYSIARAVSSLIHDFVVTDEPGIISDAQRLILPGVGSFEAGMRGLKLRGLEGVVKDFAKTGRPILGICLGAQLLMARGFEFGKFEGLGIIPGDVVKFPKLAKGIKIPHTGWNKIRLSNEGAPQKNVLTSLPKDSQVYFVHSYIFKPEYKKNILATTRYGGYEFCSAICSGNIYGTQFHPEKSGINGINIIKNFLKLKKDV